MVFFIIIIIYSADKMFHRTCDHKFSWNPCIYDIYTSTTQPLSIDTSIYNVSLTESGRPISSNTLYGHLIGKRHKSHQSFSFEYRRVKRTYNHH